MKICKCGSFAINPQCHGRDPGVDLDLCDVCYWRVRAEKISRALELRAKALQKITEIRWGWDGDCGALKIAESALEGLDEL
jgi:hypothetical protein